MGEKDSTRLREVLNELGFTTSNFSGSQGEKRNAEKNLSQKQRICFRQK